MIQCFNAVLIYPENLGNSAWPHCVPLKAPIPHFEDQGEIYKVTYSKQQEVRAEL